GGIANPGRMQQDDRRDQMMRGIAFVAPLPPPVHGFSNICAAMLDLLKLKSSVIVFDRAPGSFNRLIGMLRQLFMPLTYFTCSVKNPGAGLYVALSGGMGQAIDLSYLLIAKVLRRR